MAFSTTPRISRPVRPFPGVDVQQTVQVQAVGEEDALRVGALPPVQAAEQEGADLHVLQGVRILPLIDLDLHLFLLR